MTKTSKCVEFYLNPTNYSDEAIIESITNARKEFPGKDSKVKVEVNQWGMYRIKIEFYDKDNYINNLKRKIKKEKKVSIKNKNRTYQENAVKKYGDYKQSGIIYKPY